MTKHTHFDHIPGGKGCDFTWLTKNESLKLIIRRHWIVIFLTKLYLLAILFLTLMLTLMYKTGIPAIYIHLLIIMIWIYGIAFAFIRWINDELDIFLITDQRIIGVIQEGFLARKTIQASINHVQEVNAKTSGLLGSLLHFWPIFIQTASETTDLIMPTAANAMETSRKISDVVERTRYKRNEYIAPEKPLNS